MFDLGSLSFAIVWLTFYLSSSTWIKTFKVTASSGAIVSNDGTRLMAVVKLRPLFITDSSKELNC